ncbi:MAG: FAD-dependent oxidoreductase [Polyangiaceae bacterium]
MQIVVIGAGIAGLSAAWALSRRGHDTTVVEMEPLVFAHASGRNAAIFRPLEHAPWVSRLALRTRKLLDELFDDEPWLYQRGLLLVAQAEAALSPLKDIAASEGVACEALDEVELHRAAPELRGGRARHALWVRDAGVVDPHTIGMRLRRALADRGSNVHTRTRALRIALDNDHVRGVELQGQRLDADAVVVAAGAWSSSLAALPLTPMRRHLALLHSAATPVADHPTVWDVELETYYRVESGALLASPCDETAWTAESPPRDPAALELLAQKLAQLSPALASARVRTSWACLRTFAPDRQFVVGADPRVAGLHWLAGLGGAGLSAGVGLGELLASGMEGDMPSWAAALSPARLIPKGSSLDFVGEERVT